jgi:hypothetical protein
MSDIGDNLETNASKPRSVLVDGTQVTQHPLGDQIAADKYIEGQAAVKRAGRGLNFTKLKPGGSPG